MSDSSNSIRCPGMRDLLPDEMSRFRALERAFRETCLQWGYNEIRTPTIEHLYLFTGAGTLSPQMLGRVYSFLDWDGWSGERVVLRPDATISAARLYAEHLWEHDLAKLFYVQNVFRFAEGDESREDWQFGVELIGDTGRLGDIQLVLLAREIIEAIGLGPVNVRLSHPGIIRAILAKAEVDPASQLDLYDRILDGDTGAVVELEERIPQMKASLDMLLTVEGEGTEYLAKLRATFSQAVPALIEPLDELETIAKGLAGMSCPATVAGVLVRNFEYYTGPVFQLVVGQEHVGGGGRYDSLIGLVDKRAARPASGFALQATKLIQLARTTADISSDKQIIVRASSLEGSLIAEAYESAQMLREAGWQARVGISSTEAAPQSLEIGADACTLSQGGEIRRFTNFRAALEALGSPNMPGANPNA